MIKIETARGDLLAVATGHIVHGCNAQGVMGGGVAKAVKEKYPIVFQEYRELYKNEQLRVGEADFYLVDTKLVIWNAITQEFYGRSGRNCSYDAIQTCFAQINTAIPTFPDIPQEVHIPMIGAGLGGGNWEIIKTIIEQTMDYPTTLWIPLLQSQ